MMILKFHKGFEMTTRSLLAIFSFICFLGLSACGSAGGGSSSGGAGSSAPTVIGYAITNVESPGTTYVNAVYSDGSIKTINQVAGGIDILDFSVAKEGAQYYVFGADYQGSDIVSYSINTTNGSITVLPGTALSSAPTYCMVDRLNQYLYCGLANSTLVSFAINATTGALAQTAYSQALQSGYTVYGMIEDTPGQHFVVGVGMPGGSVLYGGYYVLTDNQNGSPTLDNQTFTTTQGTPQGFVADPGTQNGNFVFAGTRASGNFVSVNVTSFASGNTGGVQYINVTGTNNPTVAYWSDPTGTWFYGAINNASSSSLNPAELYQYTIGTSGGLTQGSMSPIPYGTFFTTQGAFYDSTNGYLIGIGGQGTLSTLSYSLSGNLTLLGSGGEGAYTDFAYVPAS
jgi:hypothetical protein